MGGKEKLYCRVEKDCEGEKKNISSVARMWVKFILILWKCVGSQMSLMKRNGAVFCVLVLCWGTLPLLRYHGIGGFLIYVLCLLCCVKLSWLFFRLSRDNAEDHIVMQCNHQIPSHTSQWLSQLLHNLSLFPFHNKHNDF